MNSVASQATPYRVSMEDYYHTRSFAYPCRSTPLESPPSYDVVISCPGVTSSSSSTLTSNKSRIHPREDEGREVLPAYSCSIKQQAVFKRKMELEGAVHKAHDRSWCKVWVELQGTSLRIYTTKSVGLFKSSAKTPHLTPDQPTFLKRGDEIKRYCLQHAEVGIAADYVKRRYVIRLRVEAEQFLLSCVEIETFLSWIESISAAIDLAPPLDDRKLPVDRTLPRIRRQRHRQRDVSSSVSTANDDLLRPHQDSGNSQTQGVAEADLPEELATSLPEAAVAVDNLFNSVIMPMTDLASPSATAAIGNSPSLDMTPSQTQIRRTPTHSTSAMDMNCRMSTLSCPDPSISPQTGKWQPTHTWTPMYDLLYAKRCMAILTRQSPHKTNFVIMKGKQWIVDWATGALSRCDPPAYGEEVELVGPWGQSIGGGFGRI